MRPRHAWGLAAVLAGCSFELKTAGVANDAAAGDARLDATSDATGDATTPDAPGSPDIDGDTVLNVADNCPQVANLDQRNHDGDSRGDACDVCPHLASTIHADNDGDGIGDDCDPRPTQAGDVVALWDGFYADSAALSWTKTGTWTLDAGALRQTATGTAYIAMPMILPRTFIQAAAVVDTVNGTSNTVGLFAGDPLDGIQSYACLAQRNSGAQSVVASAKWPGNSGSYSPVAWTGTIAAGTTLGFKLFVTSAGVGCEVRQGLAVGGDAELASGTIGRAGIYLDDVSTRIDYVFVVQIGS